MKLREKSSLFHTQGVTLRPHQGGVRMQPSRDASQLLTMSSFLVFFGLFCFAAPHGSNGEELFEVIMISFKAILNQQPTASDFAYELTQM